ncbi:TPA: antitermination protein [Proteus mirabilis]|nr:antitermination protein [Proteus mirabilis]
MKLESVLKQFYPKSSMITDSPSCTNPNKLNGMDIVGALGITGKRAKFGMSVFLAKNDINEQDKFDTVEKLTLYALKVVPKLVAKSAGNKLGYCLVILSKLAFEDYARSADSTFQCPECKGKKIIYRYKNIIKYQCITNLNGNVISEPIIKKELTGELCSVCKGKGELTYRCRCKGRGTVIDKKQTKLRGVPISKVCPRCSGRGYRRVPSSVAYQAIRKLLPELNERSWNRNWKPFYNKLVKKCFVEESGFIQIVKSKIS